MRRLVVAGVAVLASAPALTSDAPARTQQCAPADTACLQRAVTRLERAVAWQKANRFDTAYPTLREAAFLAARVFPGVSPWELLSVARCESRSGGTVVVSGAANPGSTALGPLQFLAGTWRATPFARFDRRNAFIAVMAAAQIVQREGWQQWSCRP